MKYILQESKTYDVMEKFLKNNYPELKKPLNKKIVRGEGNTGWGSSSDNYYYANVYYEDETGEPWFKKNDDSYIYSDCKWEVNDRLMYMYEFFGEELFENFIKRFFGFDLKNKGRKDHNWLFY